MPATTHSSDIPRSSPSVTSLAKSHLQSPSVRSIRVAPSGIRTVVTAPPWARDEPPSPNDQDPTTDATWDSCAEQNRPFDVASYQSSEHQIANHSRWWSFARQGFPSNPFTQQPRPESTGRGIPMRERSLSIAWLTHPIHRRSTEDESSPILKGKQPEVSEPFSSRRALDPGVHLHLSPPEPAVTTLSHNKTPGWDSPWSPRPPADLVSRISRNSGGHLRLDGTGTSTSEMEKSSAWARRRKRYRAYILNNTYVPLLFRFVNITFTCAALAMAIRIRALEGRYSAIGAVGSSPTVVVIFAPLTIVHVMVAVYLEYFGRPLGLWRTSGKLAHTLSEVVFICAWSAALALCFDNFFTSVIPCSSLSATSWYNNLPRPPPISGLSPRDGQSICHRQLALICLVGVGLIMYCYNLVISLFRIFERVKNHPVNPIAA